MDHDERVERLIVRGSDIIVELVVQAHGQGSCGLLTEMKCETAAFVCSHIFENTRPILLVARENGDWMYLCGEVHDEQEQYHVIGQGHLLERDPTLNELQDLVDNSEAERRSIGDSWIRTALTADQ